MEINFITKDDLEVFKDQIIQKINSANQNQVPKKWLRSKEVLEMLSISPGTLQNMRIQGYIPFTRVGGTLFYDLEDLNKILIENKTPAKN